MLCMRLKSRARLVDNSVRSSDRSSVISSVAAKSIKKVVLGYGCVVSVCSAAPAVMAADFLSPLPVQELMVGQLYRIGIRPSRAPARAALDTKLEVSVSGLAESASFSEIGDELWELAWQPDRYDRGWHSVQVMVHEVGKPRDVLEVRELVFQVQNSTPIEPIAWQLAPLSSQMVTQNQWLRFPVNVNSEPLAADDRFIIDVNPLPAGASFDVHPTGGRQFQWLPSTQDDREDTSQRQSVTIRIIVEKG